MACTELCAGTSPRDLSFLVRKGWVTLGRPHGVWWWQPLPFLRLSHSVSPSVAHEPRGLAEFRRANSGLAALGDPERRGSDPGPGPGGRSQPPAASAKSRHLDHSGRGLAVRAVGRLLRTSKSQKHPPGATREGRGGFGAAPRGRWLVGAPGRGAHGGLRSPRSVARAGLSQRTAGKAVCLM